MAGWAFAVHHPGVIVLEEGSKAFPPCEPGVSLEKERCCIATGSADASAVVCLLSWAGLKCRELAFS